MVFGDVNCLVQRLFFLVIKKTVTIAFKVGISNLLAKLTAHTFGVGCALQAAGAIAALGFQSLFDGTDNLFVLVKADFHGLRGIIEKGSELVSIHIARTRSERFSLTQEENGGNYRDSKTASQIRLLVHIYLHEGDIGILGRDGLQNG